MTRSWSVTYRRPDGSTGGMVSGEELHAREYALDRATAYGIPATLERWRLCDACAGHGRLAARRGIHRSRACPDCKRTGPQVLEASETIAPSVVVSIVV